MGSKKHYAVVKLSPFDSMGADYFYANDTDQLNARFNIYKEFNVKVRIYEVNHETLDMVEVFPSWETEEKIEIRKEAEK